MLLTLNAKLIIGREQKEKLMATMESFYNAAKNIMAMGARQCIHRGLLSGEIEPQANEFSRW